MLKGTMQQTPLMISGILTHAAVAHGDREVVSRLVDEPIWRYDYAGLAQRAGQAASMLQRLGVKAGDMVSSLAWNHPSPLRAVLRRTRHWRGAAHSQPAALR